MPGLMASESVADVEPRGTQPWLAAVARNLPMAALVGLCVSLAVHVVILAVMGVMVLTSAAVGPATLGQEGPAAPVQMAIMSEAELGALEEAALNPAAPGVEEQRPTSSDLATGPTIEMPGGQATPGTGDLGGVGEGLGGAGAGEGIGIGDGAGGVGGGGAKFFGVEARGRRFIFIVDTSGSMQGSKLELLRRELNAAIDGLAEACQFLVIPFESGAREPIPGPRWADAVNKFKREAAEGIGRMQAAGGTEPYEAFARALSLKPRPDAVYFMTDGLFDAAIADRIIELNRRGPKVVIHTITLADRSSADMMRKIARSTDGTYRHVDEVAP